MCIRDRDSIVFTTGTDNKANTFTGKSEKDTPSGLLVGTGLLTETNTDQTRTTSALYLEVGTWGSATVSYTHLGYAICILSAIYS